MLKRVRTLLLSKDCNFFNLEKDAAVALPFVNYPCDQLFGVLVCGDRQGEIYNGILQFLLILLGFVPSHLLLLERIPPIACNIEMCPQHGHIGWHTRCFVYLLLPPVGLYWAERKELVH